MYRCSSPIFKCYLVSLFLLFSCHVLALGQNSAPIDGYKVVSLAQSDQNYPLFGLIEYAIDEEQRYSLEQVIRGEHRLEFKPLEIKSVIRPAVKIWYRFAIANPQAEKQALILNFEEMLYDDIRLGYLLNDELVSFTTGMNYNFDSRPLDYRFFAFPIDILAQSQTPVVFSIYTSHNPLIDPVLAGSRSYAQLTSFSTQINLLTIGLCLGIFLFMAVFTPAMVRSKDAYVFSIFLLDTTLILIYMSGFVFTWIPNYPELHKLIQVFLLCFNNSITLFLLAVFYDMPNRGCRFHRLIKFMWCMFAGCFALYPWLSYEGLILPAIALTCVNYIIMIVITFYYFWLKRPMSGYFLVATSIFLASTGYAILGSQGLVPYSAEIRHMFGFGIVVQSLVYGIAVAQKVYRKIREGDESKQKAIMAEEQTRIKGEFLAAMSHEIRTPVNGVLGMAQMLLTAELHPLQRSYTDTIVGSSKTLLRVINDILDYSKVEAGKMPIESIEFSLHEVVKQTQAVFKPLIKEGEVDFVVELDAKCPQYLLGDPVRLQQVLNNLLSNAFKFTTQGEVMLTIELEQESLDSVQLLFKVDDTGIGIALTQQKYLFEAFTQADSSITRKYGGTGLGLSISSQLVQLMGSRLELKSHLGTGSCFYFSMSFFKQDQKKRPKEAEPAQYDYNFSAYKMLLVEDNPVNQQVAAAILKHYGAQVTCVDNGLEAVEYCRQYLADLDLILMDCEMPEMDGLEATRQIRKLEQRLGLEGEQRIAIVALTAHVLDQPHEDCLAAGMNLVLTKPIDKKQLLPALSSQLG